MEPTRHFKGTWTSRSPPVRFHDSCWEHSFGERSASAACSRCRSCNEVLPRKLAGFGKQQARGNQNGKGKTGKPIGQKGEQNGKKLKTRRNQQGRRGTNKDQSFARLGALPSFAQIRFFRLFQVPANNSNTSTGTTSSFSNSWRRRTLPLRDLGKNPSRLSLRADFPGHFPQENPGKNPRRWSLRTWEGKASGPTGFCSETSAPPTKKHTNLVDVARGARKLNV